MCLLPITTKDNVFIYSNDTLEEYLTSHLCLDMEDIQSLVCPKEDSYIQFLQDASEEYELLYDGACGNARAACDELLNIAEKLNSGKGMTKAQAAKAINNVINCCFDWL